MIGAATAVVLLGMSIAPFLAPPVVHFEQSRTAVYSSTGKTWAEIDAITQSLLADLVLWTGDFDVEEDKGMRFSGPVLNDAERSHMRDVRGVFTGFWILVLAGIVVLTFGFRRAKGTEARAAAWRAVRNGARALAVAIVVAGAFALLAFDAAFEVFHRLFFSAGSYTFNPATDRLVQLFPLRFWSEIAIAVGVVALGAAILTTWLAGRRAARIASAA